MRLLITGGAGFIGANFVHFLLQGLVLCAALAVFRFDVAWGYV